MTRGGFLHNEVIVSSLQKAFDSRGVETALEVATRPGRRTGYVDLVAYLAQGIIAVEAECSSRRVDRDLVKAEELGAHELWIVTPDHRVRDAVRRELVALVGQSDHEGIWILTLGQAVERVGNICSFISVSNVEHEKKKKNNESVTYRRNEGR